MTLRFLIICLVATAPLQAQINVKDSLTSGTQIHVGLAGQLPGGDMQELYGSSLSISLEGYYKTRSNWLFGGGGSFITGSTIKIDDRIFKSIETANGQILDVNGNYTTVRLFERGWSLTGRVGRIFPVFDRNPSSGLLVILGGGFLQHRIRIESIGNTAPQIMDDYQKGYDRLSNGFAATQFIGYIHSGNNRRTNFSIGLDFMQAWTQNRRGYNYDTRQADTASKLDLLYGLKITWFLPIYDKNNQTFFYY